MKCKVCKSTFDQFNSLHVVCSVPCAIKLQKQKKDQQWKVRKKELKEKIKTITDYKSDAKREFQRWCRLRDKDLPCISCGNHAKLVDGGHFKKAEVYSGVIFDERNVNLQCRKCNRFLNGNELNYREGLIKKIGIEEVEKLESLADETRIYKWTKEELEEIRIKYQTLNYELNQR